MSQGVERLEMLGAESSYALSGLGQVSEDGQGFGYDFLAAAAYYTAAHQDL